jgi:RimJ/RimL family protein N-acetyltransferase
MKEIAKLSPLDTMRFGAVCARGYVKTIQDIELCHNFFKSNNVNLAVLRSPVSDFSVIHFLENDGYRLMDCLVYYSLELAREKPIEPLIEIRPADGGDSEEIGRIAAAAFKNYYSHYHNDPKLDRSKVNDGMKDWAMRSLFDPSLSTEVLLPIVDGAIVGFATMRQNDEKVGEGVLFALAPEAQGKGVYTDLIAAGAQWCRNLELGEMIVSTQINNYAVQRAWARHGFRHNRSLFTFHKWFS